MEYKTLAVFDRSDNQIKLWKIPKYLWQAITKRLKSEELRFNLANNAGIIRLEIAPSGEFSFYIIFALDWFYAGGI
jgi:hypothetical protein